MISLRMTRILPVAFVIILFFGIQEIAAYPKQDILDYEGDDDSGIREDSVVIEGWEFEDFDVKIPRFIHLKENEINMNGADWSGLKKRLAEHERVPFSIVHIGDSHLQADISTGYVRSQMQFDYGDAGRGLVVPLRLSRTNEPVDYYFKSDNYWSPLKFMSAHWPRTMGFTGASLTTTSPQASINVGSRVTDSFSTFTDLSVFHSGEMKINSVTLDDGTVLTSPTVDYANGSTGIVLPRPVGNVTINFTPGQNFMLFGAFMSGHRPGIFYNVIGNNGATYSSYNRVPEMGKGVSRLHPDLIIISLGTNEAFGRFDAARMIDSIDRLVRELRRYNPSAEMLLVTPMECQRRSRKGYAINGNVKSVRDAIVMYGKDNRIPVYDWYKIAGGYRASDKWIGEGLYGRDRIHHTVKGYKVQGFMLYEALTKALNQK